MEADKHTDNRQFPTWYDLLALIGALLLAPVIASAVMLAVTMAAGGGIVTEYTDVVTTVTYAVMMAAAIALMLLYRRLRHARPLGLFRTGRINSTAIVGGVILIFISGIVIEPLLNLFPDEYIDMLNDAIGTSGWSILMTVVLAPVLEETLFRGILQGSIAKRYGALAGILSSALIFGAYHIVPQQAVNAFVVGTILGYVYQRTGSLSTVIFMHAANNAVAMLTLQLFGPEADISVQGAIHNPVLYWCVYAAAALILALCVLGAVRRLRQHASSGESSATTGENL